MSITTRKNLTVKALQAKMAHDKKHDPAIMLEWEIACNTNAQRGHIYNQEELLRLYDRRGQGRGATKACHIHNHNGDEFLHIVIKRHQRDGYIDEHANNPDTKQTGNQLIDEINCWNEFAERPEADFLCPILKYFTSKSDKVHATSDKMQYNIIIIAQKAVFIGDCEDACRRAEYLNNLHGYNGTPAQQRYDEMCDFSDQQGWRDAMYNPGNSGVIFDHHQGYYKAVFVDYAL